MSLMPDVKTYKQHFENKHPKAPLPEELNEAWQTRKIDSLCHNHDTKTLPHLGILAALPSVVANVATSSAPITASPFLFFYNPTIITSGTGAPSNTEGEAAYPDSHQLSLSTICHWYLCCTAYHHYYCCLLLLVFLCGLERRIRFPCLSPLAYKICINHTASQPQVTLYHGLSFTVGNLFYCNKVPFFLSHFSSWSFILTFIFIFLINFKVFFKLFFSTALKLENEETFIYIFSLMACSKKPLDVDWKKKLKQYYGFTSAY